MGITGTTFHRFLSASKRNPTEYKQSASSPYTLSTHVFGGDKWTDRRKDNGWMDGQMDGQNGVFNKFNIPLQLSLKRGTQWTMSLVSVVLFYKNEKKS